MRRPSIALSLPLLMLAGHAQAGADAMNLTELDLATLMTMDVVVTSAAGREQATADAAAAVFVITREDIRRSGAMTLPDLLRTVPGMQVAQISSRSWAVTARGFTSRFANKLLVMVDGRSIYRSDSSGVAWEEQMLFLEEIERIEVIRGPGGALWGANAVNGIINIITRSAADSQGTVVAASSGPDMPASAGVHHASVISGDTRYKVYAQHFERDGHDVTGIDWTQLRTGFRVDGGTRYSFQGEVYANDLPPFAAGTGMGDSADGGHLLASWHATPGAGDFEVKGYYNWVENEANSPTESASLGVESLYQAPRFGRHLVSVGAGYRTVHDELGDGMNVVYDPAHYARTQLSLQGQNETFFLDDALRLIAGLKIEHFSDTDFAVQPTLRSLWQLNDRHTVWAAASRAVRTPSRLELHARITTPPVEDAVPLIAGDPFAYQIRGNEAVGTEKLTALELGWRFRPSERLNIDLAVYRNDYHDLISLEALAPEYDPGPPALNVIPLQFTGGFDQRTYGAELALDWQATERLRLLGSWTLLEYGPGNADGLTAKELKEAENTMSLRARIDLPRSTELDLGWRYVDSLPYFGIPSYQAVDLRVGWRPQRQLELSLAVDNLFDEAHVEYYNEAAACLGEELDRRAFARFSWHFGR